LSVFQRPQLQIGALIGGTIVLVLIGTLVAFRRRLGVLNAASWLVVLGTFVGVGEHAQFAISYSVPLITNEGQMVLLPHARFHFFMAGIYTLVGVVLLGIVARTLLREGRRAGWYAVLFALLFGGSFDLVTGDLWYPHGLPLFQSLGGAPVTGFGWEFLYSYFVAWIAALGISYRPIFRSADGVASPNVETIGLISAQTRSICAG